MTTTAILYKRASELGFKGSGLFAYESCPKCGSYRWHRKSNGSHRLCPACGRKQGALSNVDHTREWKRASDLGKHLKKDLIFYKDACPECGVELWHKRKDIGKRMCNSCHRKYESHALARHPMWRGGRHLRKDGYVDVTLGKDSPYCGMVTKSGRVLEHRVVMAEHLGRCLEPWEVVHHRNGKRGDNQFDNLELVSGQAVHLMVEAQNKEIRLLKVQVRALIERVAVLEGQLQHGNSELNSGRLPDKCVETRGSESRLGLWYSPC